MDELTKAYWETRYQSGQTAWDIGHANTGLLEVVRKHVKKEQRILIPGAGRAYEAKQLWSEGYEEVYVCDWAEEAFQELRHSKHLPNTDRLLISDFFELDYTFDTIIEQTFFSALYPSLREKYVDKCASLLEKGGQWIGVLFEREFELPGPPFGGSGPEYIKLFSTTFQILDLQSFTASIAPRSGYELLGRFMKR